MAYFEPAFDAMIRNEGGYVLHAVANDRGGMTFAGIARKFHSSWDGWAIIDSVGPDDARLHAMVKRFYQANFWDRINGQEIDSDVVAGSLFDFAVNAGNATAIKLAQLSVGVNADGWIGPQTLSAINSFDVDLFVARYSLAKVARYAAIVNRDRSQGKFLLGWINRTLKGAQ
ncbi:MAG: glycosyl hydrolase 108 family protein [Thalassolituus sp.]|jgi:lysozyme family protein